MSYYGRFVTASGCEPMWRPFFASQTWDPFQYGSWVWYPQWGYTWVSPFRGEDADTTTAHGATVLPMDGDGVRADIGSAYRTIVTPKIPSTAIWILSMAACPALLGAEQPTITRINDKSAVYRHDPLSRTDLWGKTPPAWAFPAKLYGNLAHISSHLEVRGAASMAVRPIP